MNQALCMEGVITLLVTHMKAGREVRSVRLGDKFAKSKSMYDKCTKYNADLGPDFLCHPSKRVPALAPGADYDAYLLRYETQQAEHLRITALAKVSQNIQEDPFDLTNSRGTKNSTYAQGMLAAGYIT